MDGYCGQVFPYKRFTTNRSKENEKITKVIILHIFKK